VSTYITFRNAITDVRHQVEVSPGQTVKQAVLDSGILPSGNEFSVRDKFGHIVDNDTAVERAGELLSVGLAGDEVHGGTLGHRR
jgi:hypothetical protein